jgi:hypothetical protein
MYISGSGETVIAGSLRTFPTTTKATDTFYINSDTDAISDITLNIEFKLRAMDVTFVGTWMAHVAKDIILSLIDKVEIKLGSLNVQTLTADDIYIRNLTELGQPFTFGAPFETELGVMPLGSLPLQAQMPEVKNNIWKIRELRVGEEIVIQAACSIPFIGRSNDMSRSLLQAGALTNAVNVKVYYNNIYTNNTEAKQSHYQVLQAWSGVQAQEFLDHNYFKSFVNVRTHIISENEKKFISKNIINRVVNTSANVTKEIPKNLNITTFDGGVTDIEIDL